MHCIILVIECVQGDKAIYRCDFEAFLDDREMKFNPVPPRWHSRNPIESRHGIIRSIYLKPQTKSLEGSTELHAIRAVNISNDLYGSDVMSSF